MPKPRRQNNAMRGVLRKTLQILGALSCLAALVFGLGLTPSAAAHLAPEVALLAAGVVLLTLAELSR